MSFLNTIIISIVDKNIITGEHHMLYRQAGSENWVWKTAPNFSVGDYLMDKNGNEVVIKFITTTH